MLILQSLDTLELVEHNGTRENKICIVHTLCRSKLVQITFLDLIQFLKMIFEKFQLDWLSFTELIPETPIPKFVKIQIITFWNPSEQYYNTLLIVFKLELNKMNDIAELPFGYFAHNFNSKKCFWGESFCKMLIFWFSVQQDQRLKISRYVCKGII